MATLFPIDPYFLVPDSLTTGSIAFVVFGALAGLVSQKPVAAKRLDTWVTIAIAYVLVPVAFLVAYVRLNLPLAKKRIEEESFDAVINILDDTVLAADLVIAWLLYLGFVKLSLWFFFKLFEEEDES